MAMHEVAPIKVVEVIGSPLVALPGSINFSSHTAKMAVFVQGLPFSVVDLMASDLALT